MKFSDEELTTYLRWQGLPKDFVAADRIEQLVATNEQLEKELHTSRMASVIMDNTVAEAESKLAKAVEALRKLVKLDDDYSPFGGELLRDRVVRTWEEARIALAELEKTE